MKYIGCEPSGARFNSFSLTEDNKPFNPFVNTGAIMTCSLIQKDKVCSRFISNFNPPGYVRKIRPCTK
jgi:glutaminase